MNKPLHEKKKPDEHCVFRLEDILSINQVNEIKPLINRNYGQDLDYSRLATTNQTIEGGCLNCEFRKIVETKSYCTDQLLLLELETLPEIKLYSGDRW